MNNNNNSNNNSNGNHSWWSFLRKGSDRHDQDLAAYRRLALQLHYDLPRPDNPRSVLIVTPATSTLGARGSLILASCVAEELRRPILLIDACLRGPEVSRILNCTAVAGFSDFLSDPTQPLDNVVLPTNNENVWFLPAGGALSRPISPDSVSQFLKTAEARFEFVLVSGGSVLNDSLALSLAPCVGSVLLLVVENETMVQDLNAAQDALGFCKARKVGLVLTSPVRR